MEDVNTRLTALESDVSSILKKMSLLENMEAMMRRWEATGGAPLVGPSTHNPGASGSSLEGAMDVALPDQQNALPVRNSDPGSGDHGIRRLELPFFDRSNPDGWIFKVDRYFSMGRFIEAEKVAAAAISMEGDALGWFQWEDGR